MPREPDRCCVPLDHLSGIIPMSGAGEREGYVYFLRRHSDMALKIGWSLRPPDRAEYIARSSQDEVHLVGSFPAQRWVERHLHAQFARDRLDGEWFAPNERVQGALELVRILWGEPADSEAA